MYESEYRAYLLANNGPSFDVLTPEIMVELEIDPVLEGAQASPTRYQVSFRDGVEKVGEQWFTKYSVSDLSAEAIIVKDTEQAASVRQTRNDKLKESDWTQLVDSIADKALWATYRQTLRDISSQTGFPFGITWPEQP